MCGLSVPHTCQSLCRRLSGEQFSPSKTRLGGVYACQGLRLKTVQAFDRVTDWAPGSNLDSSG